MTTTTEKSTMQTSDCEATEEPELGSLRSAVVDALVGRLNDREVAFSLVVTSHTVEPDMSSRDSATVYDSAFSAPRKVYGAPTMYKHTVEACIDGSVYLSRVTFSCPVSAEDEEIGETAADAFEALVDKMNRSKLREFFREVQAVYMEAAGRPPSQPGINVVIRADHSAGMVRVAVGDDVRNYVPSDGVASAALAREHLLDSGYVQGGVSLKDQMERERRAATLDMAPDETASSVRPAFRLQVMEEYTQAGLYDEHIPCSAFFRSGTEYVSVDIGRHSRRHFPGQPFDRAATIEHICLACEDAEPFTQTVIGIAGQDLRPGDMVWRDSDGVFHRAGAQNISSWLNRSAAEDIDDTGHVFSGPTIIGDPSALADVLGKMGRRAHRESGVIRDADAEAMRKTLVGLGLQPTTQAVMDAVDALGYHFSASAGAVTAATAKATRRVVAWSGGPIDIGTGPYLVVDLSKEMPDKIDAQERASGCDAREGKLAWTYRKTAELEARFSATIRNTLREWPTYQGQPMTIHTQVDQGVFVLTLKGADRE